ncbi:MAG: hypothetical protein NTY90_03225 [Candidatus Micrarchaeota archaeon]|nr:hypothetical protein [Candidatus Micrarchaeota archaeon]
MKGLVSFAVVLVFAALLAHVTQTRLGAEKETYSAKSVAIALEKRYYADIDVKNAFRQVLASATGAGCEEKTADAARKLAMLEAFAEKAYGDKGVQIDLWLGEAGKTAVAELKKKMLGESAALKPPGALDFGVNVLDWPGVRQGFRVKKHRAGARAVFPEPGFRDKRLFPGRGSGRAHRRGFPCMTHSSA